MTDEYFLIGYPIHASRSPVIHNAAFDAADLDAVYELRQTSPDAFDGTMQKLLASDMTGANITAPFKQVVLAHVAPADDFVEVLGASNCLARVEGSWRAYNTDVEGFARAADSLLPQHDVAGDVTVVMLGSGGVARAVLGACAKRGWAATVVARSAAKAHQLRSVASALGVQGFVSLGLDGVPSDPTLETLAQGRGTVVFANATPLGSLGEHLPAPFSRLDPEVRIMDLVYLPTPLVAEHRARGGRALDGLHMVVEQAAVAWSIWTGRPAPREVMREAAGIDPATLAGVS